MKNTLLAAALSLLSFGTAMAQQSATVITTKASAASYMLTVDEVKALAGKDAHFALHTTNRNDWAHFDKSDSGEMNLPTSLLYRLTPGGADGSVWVWNYDGQVITGAGGGNICTWGDATDATGFDWYIAACNDGTSGSYPTDKQFRLRNAAGQNYRMHSEHDFSGAVGDWARYVAYGPFYVVNIQPQCSGESVGQPITVICSEGTLTYTLPVIDGYKPASSTITVDVNGDKDVTANYAAYVAATPDAVNLTPWPKDVELIDGSYTLPDAYTISVAGLSDDVKAEADRFVSVISTTTGKNGAVATNGTGNITLTKDDTMGDEAYDVEITTSGIVIKAKTPAGFYYGLQTIKKLLPANVMAGTAPAGGADYSLPCLTVSDEPRFAFRSFMLDCSRHFFSVDEIKRMLDVMAIYKMNTFHWHLTDDQGWRAEIEAYPELTKAGATRAKNYTVPISEVDGKWWTGMGTWDNNQYGPYFYSKADMREVVRYAAERHIEIIPEIEMPGHAVAALAAYPWLSCNPDRTYNVWTSGGISSDVMNVMNPDVIDFLHTVIDEICDVFPGRYFHIGGDECPTSAWEGSAGLQEYMQANGLSNVREVQSLFINQISKYIKDEHKKTTVVWNESITAANANKTLVAEHKPVIMCWTPCQSAASQAAALGLDAVITEYHGANGGYYINRKQSNDYGEPDGAGAGDDTVEGCYNYVPVPASVTDDSHYLGVQGTFWTESVSSDEYLEYLALPRLMCLAEAGWVRQDQKNWDSFVTRMLQDKEILDLGGYLYGQHWNPDYEHRVYVSPIADNAIVTFTNHSSDRGRCIADANGSLNAQANACTNFVLEPVEGQEDQYYIRSAASGKYLYADGTAENANVSLSETKTAWTFDTTTIPSYVAIVPVGSNYAINNNTSNATHACLKAHGSGNTSSFWFVGAVEPEPELITDGSTLNFTNKDTYRGRFLADEYGTLNGQGSTKCDAFTLEAVPNQTGQYYIRSEKSGKYLYAASTNTNDPVVLSADEKTAWTFDTSTIEGFVAICPVGNPEVAINNNIENPTHACLKAHGTGNTSSFWELTVAEPAAPEAPNVATTTGDVVRFTNKDNNRPRFLADDTEGHLNGQGAKCTDFTLEPAEEEGQFYVRSLKSGKYLYAANVAQNAAVTLSDDKQTVWTFDTTTFEGFVAICPVENTGLALNNNDSSATHACLKAHGTGNTSSFWSLAILGDANGNGEVTINDVVYTIGVLLGTNSGNANADADSDELITTDDVEGIASKILRK